MQTPSTNIRNGCFVLVGLFALLVGLIAFCSPRDIEGEPPGEEVPPPAEASVPVNPSDRQELEGLRRDLATVWASVPETPLGMCDMGDPGDGLCAAAQIGFIRDWPEAWRADYQARRNVAFCFESTCDHAVPQNLVAACAWRIAIAESGDPRIDDLDLQALRQACSRLDPPGATAADAMASRILTVASGQR